MMNTASQSMYQQHQNQNQNQHRSSSVSKELPTTRMVNFQFDQQQQQQPKRSASTTRVMSSSSTTTGNHHHQQQQQRMIPTATTTTTRDRNSWGGNPTRTMMMTTTTSTTTSPLKQRQLHPSQTSNEYRDQQYHDRGIRPRPPPHTTAMAMAINGTASNTIHSSNNNNNSSSNSNVPPSIQYTRSGSSNVSPFGNENDVDNDNHNNNYNDDEQYDSPDRMAQAIWTLREARMNASSNSNSNSNNSNQRSSSRTKQQQHQQQSQKERFGASSPPPAQRNHQSQQQQQQRPQQHNIRSVSAPRPNIDMTKSTNKQHSSSINSGNGNGKQGEYQQHHNQERLPSIQQQQQQQRSNSTTRLSSSNNSNNKQQSSPEEVRAVANIQRAEAKIDGLLQELEDLRFLEEIDLQDTPTIVVSPTIGTRSKSAPRIRHNDYHSDNDEDNDNERAYPLKTPRGDTIPAIIRAISPQAVVVPPVTTTNQRGITHNPNTRSQKLPPPTAVAITKEKKSEPSMVQLLSPRVISKMERMTLELETQTLCRKFDVLNKEKSTLEKVVETYEASLQEHERNSGMVQKYEKEVRNVRQELHQTKQDMNMMREQIRNEYEHRLQESVNKLQRTQAMADKYQQDRILLQTELDNLRQEYKEFKMQHKDEETRNRIKQQEKEAALELQLQEVADLADELKDECEGEKEVVRQLSIKLKEELATRDEEIKQLRNEMENRKIDVSEQIRTLQQEWRNKLSAKDREISQLHDKLRDSEKIVEHIKNVKDDAYEVQIGSLQEQLALQNEKYNKLEQSRIDAVSKIKEQDEELMQVKAQCTEQTELLKDMTERLDAVHIEYRDKFVDLKDAYETKEKRRLQEMVQSHTTEVDEYESRIKSLQEQLTHQNDRHHKEIDMKNDEYQKVVESHSREKKELIQDHKQIVLILEEKLMNMKLEYDHVANERSILRKELDTMPTKEDTIKERQERERQDVMRDNEISRLTDKAERLSRDVTTKNDRIQELSNKLVEAERQYEQKVNRLKSLHTDALFQREQELSEQIKQMRSIEVKLRCDVDRKDTELLETKSIMESRISEFQSIVDEHKRDIETIRRRNDETESVLRGEISVLEGKLRGAETIIQQKCDIIDDLKERLEMSTSKEITSVEAHKIAAERLSKEMKSLKDQLYKERDDLKVTIESLHNNLKEKTTCVTKLEGMLSVANTKCESLDERLKEMESACRDAKAELIAERTRHTSAEEETRVDMAILQGKFRASEASLKEKRETIEELEDQLRSIADESSTTNKELQKEVDQLRLEVKKLNDQLDKDRAELFTKGELLKQQQKKLQQSSDEIIVLQQTIASSVQLDENRNRDLSNLRAALDQAMADLQSERLDKKNTITSLQDQLDATKIKLEDQLRTVEESSTTNTELQKEVHQLQLEVKKLNDQLDRDQAELSAKEELLKEQQTKLQQNADAMIVLQQSVASGVELDENRSRDLSNLRLALDQAIIDLDSERLDKKNSISILQDQLDAAKTKLRTVTDESTSSIVHLKTEINSLQYDIKMSNDLLNKERAAMDIKVEEYEQLKVMNWNLRQKASRVESLENMVAELRESLEETRADRSVESNSIDQSLVKDLQDRLDVERREKEDVKSRLAETESELEIKQQQLSRLPALQAQLKQLVDEREELQRQFSQLEGELDRKTSQIDTSSESNSARIASLEAELHKSKSLRASLQKQLQSVELELSKKIESSNRLQIDNNQASNQQLILLQTKVDQLTKAKALLEAKIRELEEDKEDREKQVRESSEKYSNQILELQIQVEELSRKKTSLRTRLSRLESDLEYKDEQMSVASSQVSGDISNLQSMLSERIAENESLCAKLQTLEAQVAEIESMKTVQMKLDAESKEKRSLLTKIGDIEAELQRKEKQIRDVVDRYTRDIAELEYKLEDQTRSKSMLEKEVEKFRRGESTASDSDSRIVKDQSGLVALQRANTDLQIQVKKLREDLQDALGSASEEKIAALSKENSALQEKLQMVSLSAEKTKKRLEEQLDAAILNNEVFSDRVELEEKLTAMEKSKIELEERLKKVNSERTEVITALEEVISEVQSREDEIESLATVLRKRDEELEHAKLIATKAIASAQEMKQRLKNKNDVERSQKSDELNNSIDFLTKKNESLERKTTLMERELKQKELECGELRNKLQRSSAKGNSNIAIKLEGKTVDDGFHSIDPDFQATFDSCSPTTKASSAFVTADSLSMGSIEQPPSEMGWLHNFDSNSHEEDSDEASAVSFSGIHTAVSDAQSRRSIERDALRKYVRKRYMKSKA